MFLDIGLVQGFYFLMSLIFIKINNIIYSNSFSLEIFCNDSERHSNPTNSVLNTVDGLLPLVDDVQSRLQQLHLEHKVKFSNLLVTNQSNFSCNNVLIGIRLKKQRFKMKYMSLD